MMSLLTLEQKSAEFKKLWLIIDESDAIKRKRDFVNMAQNYGIKTASLENEVIKENTEGKNIIKVIVIKGRLVNIVVK